MAGCVPTAPSPSAAHRTVPRERTRHDGGGYDCEFVLQPPDAIQAECPICLQVLKEPCLISCPCGQKICRECVEQIKENNKPCPLCNLTDFTFMRDYGLERYLKEQEVWCSKRNDGCEWKGKLGEYEQHLNRNPSPENQLTGCQFVEVECEHGCGEWFQRSHIAAHQKRLCRRRPYSCEYCHKYESTFEDVTKNHHHQCNKFPVTCPNKCQEAPFERQKVENHVKVECPLTEVNCPLHYAGCEVKLPHKDMPEHMSDTVTHLTLLATVTLTLLKENQELKQHNQQLAVKQSTTETHCQELEGKLKAAEKEIETLKEDVREMKLTFGGYPIDFHVNFANKESLFLPSFYTHSHGYRMCIQVFPNGNKEGEGTHVSIYTRLMKGQFDDHLKWPFRGIITIQIVNQAGDHSHVEWSLPYDDNTPDDTAGRVTDMDMERAKKGWGYYQFLALADLGHNAVKKTQYLKDDIIIVRVVSVEVTK